MDEARIYISGPITGIDAYETRFEKAEDEVRKLDSHYIPINPARLGLAFGEGLDYSEYMQLDIQLLGMCDGIYMLDGWEDSKGARMELEYAKMRGMMIFYQSTKSYKSHSIPNVKTFADVYAAISLRA